MKRIFLILFLACASLSSLPAQTPVEGLNVGNIAPDIVMTDTSGVDSLKLSSLRGQLVLIDFWASWCGPCRAENPNVVRTYKQYHDQYFVSGNGFEVFSVSFDRPGAKSAWINAIKRDSLYWKNHVSDLQWWNNAAGKRYGIYSIPTNVLIDKNGVIIAKNLRGAALEGALKTQLETDATRISEMKKEREKMEAKHKEELEKQQKAKEKALKAEEKKKKKGSKKTS